MDTSRSRDNTLALSLGDSFPLSPSAMETIGYAGERIEQRVDAAQRIVKKGLSRTRVGAAQFAQVFGREITDVGAEIRESAREFGAQVGTRAEITGADVAQMGEFGRLASEVGALQALRMMDKAMRTRNEVRSQVEAVRAVYEEGLQNATHAWAKDLGIEGAGLSHTLSTDSHGRLTAMDRGKAVALSAHDVELEGRIAHAGVKVAESRTKLAEAAIATEANAIRATHETGKLSRWEGIQACLLHGNVSGAITNLLTDDTYRIQDAQGKEMVCTAKEMRAMAIVHLHDGQLHEQGQTATVESRHVGIQGVVNQLRNVPIGGVLTMVKEGIGLVTNIFGRQMVEVIRDKDGNELSCRLLTDSHTKRLHDQIVTKETEATAVEAKGLMYALLRLDVIGAQIDKQLAHLSPAEREARRTEYVARQLMSDIMNTFNAEWALPVEELTAKAEALAHQAMSSHADYDASVLKRVFAVVMKTSQAASPLLKIGMFGTMLEQFNYTTKAVQTAQEVAQAATDPLVSASQITKDLLAQTQTAWFSVISPAMMGLNESKMRAAQIEQLIAGKEGQEKNAARAYLAAHPTMRRVAVILGAGTLGLAITIGRTKGNQLFAGAVTDLAHLGLAPSGMDLAEKAHIGAGIVTSRLQAGLTGEPVISFQVLNRIHADMEKAGQPGTWTDAMKMAETAAVQVHEQFQTKDTRALWQHIGDGIGMTHFADQTMQGELIREVQIGQLSQMMHADLAQTRDVVEHLGGNVAAVEQLLGQGMTLEGAQALIGRMESSLAAQSSGLNETQQHQIMLVMAVREAGLEKAALSGGADPAVVHLATAAMEKAVLDAVQAGEKIDADRAVTLMQKGLEQALAAAPVSEARASAAGGSGGAEVGSHAGHTGEQTAAAGTAAAKPLPDDFADDKGKVRVDFDVEKTMQGHGDRISVAAMASDFVNEHLKADINGKNIDEDGVNRVLAQQLQAWGFDPAKPPQAEELAHFFQHQFAVLDKDGDGFITKAELAQHAGGGGLATVLIDLDKDGDGNGKVDLLDLLSFRADAPQVAVQETLAFTDQRNTVSHLVYQFAADHPDIVGHGAGQLTLEQVQDTMLQAFHENGSTFAHTGETVTVTVSHIAGQAAPVIDVAYSGGAHASSVAGETHNAEQAVLAGAEQVYHQATTAEFLHAHGVTAASAAEGVAVVDTTVHVSAVHADHGEQLAGVIPGASGASAVESGAVLDDRFTNKTDGTVSLTMDWTLAELRQAAGPDGFATVAELVHEKMQHIDWAYQHDQAWQGSASLHQLAAELKLSHVDLTDPVDRANLEKALTDYYTKFVPVGNGLDVRTGASLQTARDSAIAVGGTESKGIFQLADGTRVLRFEGKVADNIALLPKTLHGGTTTALLPDEFTALKGLTAVNEDARAAEFAAGLAAAGSLGTYEKAAATDLLSFGIAPAELATLKTAIGQFLFGVDEKALDQATQAALGGNEVGHTAYFDSARFVQSGGGRPVVYLTVETNTGIFVEVRVYQDINGHFMADKPDNFMLLLQNTGSSSFSATDRSYYGVNPNHDGRLLGGFDDSSALAAGQPWRRAVSLEAFHHTPGGTDDRTHVQEQIEHQMQQVFESAQGEANTDNQAFVDRMTLAHVALEVLGNDKTLAQFEHTDKPPAGWNWVAASEKFVYEDGSTYSPSIGTTPAKLHLQASNADIWHDPNAYHKAGEDAVGGMIHVGGKTYDRPFLNAAGGEHMLDALLGGHNDPTSLAGMRELMEAAIVGSRWSDELNLNLFMGLTDLSLRGLPPAEWAGKLSKLYEIEGKYVAVQDWTRDNNPTLNAPDYKADGSLNWKDLNLDTNTTSGWWFSLRGHPDQAVFIKDSTLHVLFMRGGEIVEVPKQNKQPEGHTPGAGSGQGGHTPGGGSGQGNGNGNGGSGQ